MIRIFRNKVIAISYVGWMFDFYDLALFSFLIPMIGRDFSLSNSQEAWLLGLGLGASGLGGILFGWLGDRFGRKRLLGLTILLYSLGTGLSAFSHGIVDFFILRGLAGLGIGGEWAIGHALVAESVDGEHRGKAAALLQSGEPVGVALAAMTGLLLAPWIGWRAVLALSGLTGFWAVIVRTHLPESPLWKPARTGSPEWKKARDWMLSPLGLSFLVRGFLLATFKLGTYWTCYVWLPKFFLQNFHEPIGRSALWILTAQAGQLAGMLFFGSVSDEYGRRPAYTVYSCLTALALATLAFKWNWLLHHRGMFWGTMLTLGFGSGCTAGFGALLAELFPTEVRNLGMGIAYNLARGIQIFAPPMVAYYASNFGVRGALLVPFSLAVLTAAWVWTLPDTRKRNLARFSYSDVT